MQKYACLYMGFLRPKYFFSETLIFALYNEV